MDSRVRELQELIARYAAFMEGHDEKFAGVEVHAGCVPRMEKILDKWKQELEQLKSQKA
ncbi:MAG: hypothetical protein K2W95_11500 [Candidatus Obscuribacterales bacterium]|nr:hypothetical protein [Candidatus Obscuribacterales bacterium]